jgi:hypothetical protein
MTDLAEREVLKGYVANGVAQGARKEAVCKLLGLSVRTLQRWEKNPGSDKRPEAEHKSQVEINILHPISCS